MRPPGSRFFLVLAASAVACAGCKGTGLFKGKKGDDPPAADGAAPPAIVRSPEEEAFLAKCAELGASGMAVAGVDGYCFDVRELNRLGSLAAPDQRSARIAMAAIVDYHRQLRRKGTEVVLVPVPPKAVVFADKLSKDLKLPRRWSRSPKRLDSPLQTIYAGLRNEGMTVIDVTDDFLKQRVDRKAGGVFAKGGETWTPRGARIAAEAVAAPWKNADWAGRPDSQGTMVVEEATTTWTGPLFASAGIAPVAESLAARNVGQAAEGKMRSVTFSQGGHPLGIMGDGSILAWREANNPKGSSGVFASLADQLAFELRTTPDVFPNSADGRNAPRLKILRDGTNGRDTLARTKVLLWVVPATDFALNDWRKVPLRLNFELTVPDLELEAVPAPGTPSPRRTSADDSPADDSPNEVPLPE